MLSCVEICAGAGGQALGLARAGFEPEALVEIEVPCCNTLRANRPHWNVIEGDLKEFDGTLFRGVDLLARGVPWPACCARPCRVCPCDIVCVRTHEGMLECRVGFRGT